jgi:methionyl-tRNA formyltransferase
METLDDIETALHNARAQDETQVTYAPRLVKRQAEVEWKKPLALLLREVRAFNPWPVSYTFVDDQNLRLWRAQAGRHEAAGQAGEVVLHDKSGVYVQCGDGVLRITELQYAGRNRCDAEQALNARNLSGSRLGKA